MGEGGSGAASASRSGPASEPGSASRPASGSARSQLPAAIAVVVVNWNGAHLLPRCLSALAGQRGAPPFATWVVDNGSTDATHELLARDFSWVQVITSATNRGFAGGNNLALRHLLAESDPPSYVVLLNNDAVPEPDWLAALVTPLTAPGGERVAAVASKVLLDQRFLAVRISVDPGLDVDVLAVRRDGTDVTTEVPWAQLAPPRPGRSGHRLALPGTLLVPLVPPDRRAFRLDLQLRSSRAGAISLNETAYRVSAGRSTLTARMPAHPAANVLNSVGGEITRDGYGADRGWLAPDVGQYDAPAEVFTAPGTALALRVTALREIGLLDESFFLYYEDTDLCWRLRLAGWSVRAAPAAVVRHAHGASAQLGSPFFAFHDGRNRLLTLVKNAPGPLAARECLRHPLSTLSLALRARDHAEFAMVRVRVRAFGSLLRLLPTALAARRKISRGAVRPRGYVAGWLGVSSRELAESAIPTPKEHRPIG